MSCFDSDSLNFRVVLSDVVELIELDCVLTHKPSLIKPAKAFFGRTSSKECDV